jgi:ABC-2 type transport system permease protein
MTEEKENRTMEVIITSLSPSKMMAGKITAIIAIGITQLLVWFGLIFLGISIWAESNNSMRDINIPIGMAALMAVTLLLAFVMISAIIAAVGAIVTEATEGQQITGPFSIPFIIPYLFAFQILNDPNGTLAVIMTFVPFTAPVTLIMRTSLAVIPPWQILLSLLIQVTCVLILVWLAGRAFRVGMLQYRRHLTWRELFNRSG